MKTMPISTLAVGILMLLCVTALHAQAPPPVVNFTEPVGGASTLTLQGDMQVIGNAMTGFQGTLFFGDGTTEPFAPTDDFNYGNNNDGLFQNYININALEPSPDPTIFSSSSADFALPTNCSRIAYAGLYWTATYYTKVDEANGDYSPQYTVAQADPRPDFRTVKLRMPGRGFVDVTAEPGRDGTIFNGWRNTLTNSNDQPTSDASYVCYADVTSLLQGLADPTTGDANADGTYTVANVRSTTGATISGHGISSGWTLVIIYEDSTLSRKFFSTRHGFLEISGTAPQTFEYTGFQTLPAPNPIRARFASATLEGDYGIPGDGLQILSQPLAGFPFNMAALPVNPTTNFFNGSISVDGQFNNARNPASINTLGFDLDIFDIPNTNNIIIGNDQTSVDFNATTSGDRYRIFLNAFTIEVIEPELNVFKRVLDNNGNDITGGDVVLGQELFYELNVQNVGNESIIDASILDILPANVDLNESRIILPSGVTYSYDDVNRRITFIIDDTIVERFDGQFTIRFGVEVVNSCATLRDACSNEIENIALSNYTGVQSGVSITNQESVLEQNSCRLDIVGTSNFLIGLDSCDGNFDAYLCSGSLDLIAGGGFPNYIWTDLSTGNVVGNSQILTVTTSGQYRVDKTGNPDCNDLFEIWTVNAFNSVTNPIVPIAQSPGVNGNVRTCPITGDELPEIFLCGASDSQSLTTNFLSATNISWQRLDPAACSSVPRNAACPTTDSTCDPDWAEVATSVNYTVTQPGEYRIRVEFDGNCEIDFYFNVYQNNFEPTLRVVQDIVCGNEGIIRVENSSNQYEYQLIFPDGSTSAYQTNPEFSGLTVAGSYNINARQNNGLPTACVFNANPSVLLENLDSMITVSKQDPFCPDDLGQVTIQVTDSDANYVYNISSTTNSYTASEGPTTSTSHTFIDLNPDVYDIEVTSYNGLCLDLGNIEVLDPPAFTATASLLRDLSCNSNYQPDISLPNYDPDEFIALVRVTITGGSGNFSFLLDGTSPPVPLSSELSTTYDFRFTTARSYAIQVSDNDTSCTIVTNAVTVNPYTPVTATATAIDAFCSTGTGAIEVNVTGSGAPFDYILDGSVTVNTSTNPYTFNGVSIGAHTIEVLDRFGCPIDAPIDVTIGVTGAITADIAVTRQYQCRANGEPQRFGQIRITNPSGGNGNYEYSIDNVTYGTNSTFGGLREGDYTLYIRDTDTAACPITLGTLTINPLQDVIDLDFAPTQLVCPNQEADVTVSATVTNGGTAEVRITAPAAEATGYQTTPFTGLNSGTTYTFQARTIVSGIRSCLYTETYTVPTIDLITVNGNPIAEPVCNGGIEGGLSFTVGGIDLTSTTYAYEISGGSITGSITATNQNTSTVSLNGSVAVPLEAGTYSVVVTDETTNCSANTDITITEPDVINFSLAQDEADCGASTGAVSVNTVTGGRGGYEFELRDTSGTVLIPYQTNNIFSGLASGDYVVAVRDNNAGISCEDTPTQNITVGETGPPTIAITGGDFCYDVTGQASVDITITPNPINTVTPNYQYSVNGNVPVVIGNVTTINLTGLTPQNYSVVVTDLATVCPTPPLTFTIDSEPTVTASITKGITCAPNPDATIAFTTSAGTTLDILRPDGTTESDYTGANPYVADADGTYTFTVTNSVTIGGITQNCTESTQVTVDPFVGVTSLIDSFTEPFCIGDTGTITVTASGGRSPYTFNLDSGAQTVTQAGATYTFTNVSAGGANHTIDVTDADNCAATQLNQIINDPTPITADVAVTKEIECDASGSSITPIGATVEITNVQNATGTISYTLNGVTNTTGVFTGLSDGNYTYSVEDVNTAACPLTGSITVDPLPEVTDLDFTISNPSCSSGNATYVINATATGINGATTFEYRVIAPTVILPDTAGTGTFTLAAGTTYTFEARTTPASPLNSCVYTEDFSVPDVDQIEVNGTITAEPICNGGNEGALSFTISGIDLTSTTYEYTVSGGATPITPITATGQTTATINISNLEDGTYTIDVTDETTNCTDSTTIEITEPGEITFNLTPDAADCGASTGSITVDTVTGGRGGYEYELRNSTGTTVLTAWQSSNLFSNLASGDYQVAVRDTSASGSCEVAAQSITVAETGPPTVAITGGDFCYDVAGQASVDITITPNPINTVTPNYQYSVNGNAPVVIGNVTTINLTGLTPQNYSVVITDLETTCPTTALTFTIDPEPTVTASITKGLTCAPNPEATIAFTTSAGSTLDILRPDGTTESDYTGANPYVADTDGTYTFTVTNTVTIGGINQNCTTSTQVIVDPYVGLTTAIDSFTEPFCIGDTGTITVTASGGRSPYTFDLDSGAQTVTQAGATYTFTNVSAGGANHTIDVTDADNCVATQLSQVINDPTPITAAVSSTPYKCNSTTGALENATITVTGATNGTPPYAYSIDGVDFTNTSGSFTGLTNGTYDVYVRDGNTNACPVNLGSVVIAPLDNVTDIVVTTINPVTCPSQTSDIRLSSTTTSGGGTVEYQITLPVSEATTWSTNTDFNLPAGNTYTFEARTTTSECVYSENFTISPIDQIGVTASVTAEPTCPTDTDASLSFSVSNIDLTTNFYTYEITGSTAIGPIIGQNAASISINSLGAGSYTVEVTDETSNCVASATVTINDPDPINFTPVINPADCGANTASISITGITGGRGGYQYELRDASNVVITAFQAGNSFTGLTGGVDYIVAVRDNLGGAISCTVIQTITVPVTPALTIAAVNGGDACYDITDQASQWITISGGIAPFEYSLNGSAFTAATLMASPPAPANTFEIPNLVPNTYTVEVRDTNNCSSTTSFTIQPELTITASLTKDLDCSGSPDATVEVTTTGGNGSDVITVDLDATDGTPNYVAIPGTWGAASPYSVDTAGSYQFRVTDSEGCAADSSVITVNPAPEPVATATVTDVTCNGASDGSVVITIDTTVGTGPYEIDFDGGGFSNNTTYGNLAAATYTYFVRDAKGCVNSTAFSVTVGQPNLISGTIVSNEITCDDTVTPGTVTLGSIDVTGIAGGTGDYTVSLLEPDFTVISSVNVLTSSPNTTFSNLDFGNYIIRIEDARGCIVDYNTNIATDPIFTINATAVSDCTTGVTLNINIIGGTGASGFDIREYPSGTFGGVNAPPRDHTFTNLPFGLPFTFEVRDNFSGCTDIQTFNAPNSPSAINITPTVTNVSCNSAGDGELAYSITGYSGNELTYEVLNADDLNDDRTGVVTFSSGNPQTGLTGANVTGTISDLDPGNYVLRVIETDGTLLDACNDAITFTITEPTAVNLVETSNTPGDCITSAEVVVNGQGGTGPYTYAAVQDGAAAPVLGAYTAVNVFLLDQSVNTDWDIYMLDANSCPFGPLDVTVSGSSNPAFTTVPTEVDDPCVFDNNYTFTVIATGSTALEFGIDDGDTTTADVPVFVAGTPTGNPNEYQYQYTVTSASIDQYTLTVRDGNGCTDTNSIVVYQELIVSASFTTDPDCRVDDGTVTVVVTGGSDFVANPGNFTFNLTGTDSNSNPVNITQAGVGGNIFSGNVSAGTYTVTVTDTGIIAAGCTVTTNVSRDIPVDPVITAVTLVNPSCPTAIDGSITVVLDPTTDNDTPLTYELYDTSVVPGNLLQTNTDNPIFDTRGAGNYIVLVRSSTGCEVQSPANLIDPSQVIASATQTAYGCAADNSADFPDITVTIADGTAPYTISYTTPSGTNFSNLSVTGTSFVFTATESGTYDIDVLDANNCAATTINEAVPAFPIISGESVVRDTTSPLNGGLISCDNPETVVVSVTDDGLGTGNFIFEVLETGVINDTALLDFDTVFTLPSVGTYTIEITDERTGCTETVTYDVAPFDTIAVTATLVTDVSCFSDTTGEIDLNITGYTGAYNYIVRDAATAAVIVPSTGGNTTTNPLRISGLPAGTFEVAVEATDSPFCDEASNTVTIDQPTALTLALNDATTPFCTDLVSHVSVDASGGAGGYNYQVVAGSLPQPDPATFPLGATFDLDPTTSLTWVVFVQDGNGCITSIDITIPAINPNPVLDALPAFVDDACIFDNDYEFTVTASGTGTLTYQLDMGIPEIGNISNTSHQFRVTAPGMYQVTVYDENGCPSNQESITVYPELLVTADFTTEPTCRDANGEITVSVSGGSGVATNWSYTLIDANTNTPITGPQPSNTFSGIVAGNYRVDVTDSVIAAAPGCTVSAPVSRDIPTDPAPVVNPTAVSCVGASDGTILVDTPVGVDTPYTYQLWDSAGTTQIGLDQPDPLFENLTAGDYNVIVISGRSCSSALTPITVGTPTQVTASTAQTAYGCAADNSAVFPDITVTIADGTAPYTISYTTPSGTSFSNLSVTGTSFVFTATESGTYDIDVLDANNCAATTINEVVPAFPIISGESVVRDVTAVNGGLISCDNPETVVVSVTNDGLGTGNFIFEVLETGVINDTALLDFDTVFTLPSVGTYTIEITDERTGCTETVTYDVAPFDTIAVTATLVTDVSCFSDTTGEIDLNITGYTGAYNYIVRDAATAAVIVPSTGGNTTTNPLRISGLPAGTFEVAVEATASPFCDEVSNTVTIDQPTALTLALDDATTPFCTDLVSHVSVDASGGAGSYNYQVVAGSLPQPDPATFPLGATFDLDPATSLNWVVFVQDGNGCITSLDISIPDVNPNPVLNALPAFVDDACTFDNDYTFTVTASGTGTLTYQLDSGIPEIGNVSNTEHQFRVTAPGTYQVTVYDENGCPSNQESITVYPELLVTADFTTEPTCRDANGEITVSVGGGSGVAANWMYTLVNSDTNVNISGPQTSNVFSGVAAGNYRVDVTDSVIAAAPGCTVSAPVSRDIPTDPVPVVNPTAVSCVGASDGTILVDTPVGVDTPYVYQLWDSVGTTQIGADQPDPLFENLAAGDYNVIVISGRSCSSALTPITVGTPTQVTASTAQIAYGCATDNSDVFPDIVVTIVDGTPDYTISYTGPSIVVTSQPVVDADPMTAGVQFIIDADIAGNYDITVQDANNCSFALPTETVNPFPIMTDVIVNPITGIDCNTNVEEVTVTITGGTGPFDIVEVSGAVVAQNNIISGGTMTTSGIFALPGVGSYVFRITDQDTGCTIDTEPYEIAPYDTIVAVAAIDTEIQCATSTDGVISLDVSGYTGDYTYQVNEINTLTTVRTDTGNTGTNPILISNLAPGFYEIVVTEDASPFCTTTSNNISLTAPAELRLSLSVLNPESCDPTTDASIQAIAEGGTGVIEYQLEQPAGNILFAYGTDPDGIYEGLIAGIPYTVSVRDENNCITTDVITITPSTPPTAIVTVTGPLACFDSNDGEITVQASGGQGIGSYLFSITRPDGTTSTLLTSTTDTFVFTGLSSGNHTITVTDNLNCTVTIDQDMIAPIELDITVETIRDPSCSDRTADMRVTVSGGTPPYEYSLDAITYQSADTFTSLPDGSYQFYARDANGCTVGPSNALPVNAPVDLSVTLDDSNWNIVCFGENTASVDATVTGGLGNYMYTLTGTETVSGATINVGPQTESFFGELLAGTYTYSVTSEDCPQVDTNFTIIEPEDLVVTANPINISCNGANNGSIEVIAQGGTAPYVYSLYDVNDQSLFLFIEDDVDGNPGTHIFEELSPGTYRVELADNRGCPEIITDIIITEPSPIDVQTINKFDESCMGDSDGEVTVFISGGLVGADPANPEYYWSLSQDDPFQLVTDPTNFTVSNLPSGQNVLFIRDANNDPDCQLALLVDIAPGIDLTGRLERRFDCPELDIFGNPIQDTRYYVDFIFNSPDDLDLGSLTFNLYQGTDNTGTPVAINPLTPGIFEVSGPGEYYGEVSNDNLNPNFCLRGFGITVSEYTSLNSLSVLMTNNPEDPNEYQLSAQGGTGELTYSWAILPEGIDDAQLQTIVDQLPESSYTELEADILLVRETARYVIRAVDESGCEIKSVNDITYINIRIPNYFTPGQDDPSTPENEGYWYPRQISFDIGQDPFFFENIEVKIFDRYGRLLETFTGDQQGWDGIYQGSLLPSGDYWFSVILNDVDNREFIGNFTLYR